MAVKKAEHAGLGKYAGTRSTEPIVARQAYTSPFSRQDPELIAALRDSLESGANYALFTAEVPLIVRKGETIEPTIVNAEQFVRRHASEAGVGVSIAALPDGTGIRFQAKPRRVVATGAARRPRTPKTA